MSGMMPPEMPAALQGAPPLAQMLQQQPLLDQSPPQEEPADPLQALQDAIHSLMAAMVALPDAEDVKATADALKVLAGVQSRLMKGAPGAAAQG